MHSITASDTLAVSQYQYHYTVSVSLATCTVLLSITAVSLHISTKQHCMYHSKLSTGPTSPTIILPRPNTCQSYNVRICHGTWSSVVLQQTVEFRNRKRKKQEEIRNQQDKRAGRGTSGHAPSPIRPCHVLSSHTPLSGSPLHAWKVCRAAIVEPPNIHHLVSSSSQ